METEFVEDGIVLVTEGILERLFLERLNLKVEGDMCECIVTYEGSFLAIKLKKREVGDNKRDGRRIEK